jgi:hypothetical protein
VFRCRKDGPAKAGSKYAQLADRTALESQLEEYRSGVVLSQKPPEPSRRRRPASKKIALRLGRAALPYSGPGRWSYRGRVSP